MDSKIFVLLNKAGTCCYSLELFVNLCTKQIEFYLFNSIYIINIDLTIQLDSYNRLFRHRREKRDKKRKC